MKPKMILFPVTVFLLIGFISLLITNKEDQIYNEPESMGALDALDHFSFSRAYPGTTIPPDKFYKAFDLAKSRFNKSADIHAEDTWRNLGPGNFGGRTLALAVHPITPNIVYAGSASGGLWKLTIDESGQNTFDWQTGEGEVNYTWDRINTGFPVLGVGAIAINAENPDQMYIGTGEVYAYQASEVPKFIRTTRGSYGIGILRSSDGGITWQPSLDWSYDQKRGVQALKIKPDEPSVVFAATTEGLFRSSDAGASWQNVNPVLMGVDIAINPDYPDTIFASHGNFGSLNHGIYRSFDGGDTWTKLGGELPFFWRGKTMLSIYEAEPNIIYADITNEFGSIGIYKSIDNGDTWEFLVNMNLSGIQGWYSHFLRVHPENNSDFFYGGQSMGFSHDEGTTIEQLPRLLEVLWADFHAYANHPSDPNTFYIANDGGVFRTTDNKVSYENFHRGYVTAQFYPGFSSSKTDPDFAIGGTQDRQSWAYEGSDIWRNLGTSDGNYTAIHPFDNNIIYLSSQRLSMRRSMDKGLTSQFVRNFPIDASRTAFIAPYILLQTQTLYAASDMVWRSDDGGTTWHATNDSIPLNGNPILSLAGSQKNPNIVYAATSPPQGNRQDDYSNRGPIDAPPEIYRSTNGGISWINVTTSLPDRFFGNLHVSPHNDNTVYVPIGGFGTSHLFVTDDAGQTWRDIDNGQLPDVPTSAVVVDPKGKENLYVGNDLGVWASEDGGQTWSEFKEGMPNAAIVMDLSISESNRKLRAVTHGNGVYERSLLLTKEEKEDLNPTVFTLLQNYPNPFNPRTTIAFRLPEAATVSLKIFNILGQEVRSYPVQDFTRGRHNIIWDSKNNFGHTVATGTYIYRLKAGNITQTRKMVLMK